MACASCSPSEFVAARLDTWKTALKVLTNVDWAGDETDIGPSDVLLLAMFLEGAAND